MHAPNFLGRFSNNNNFTVVQVILQSFVDANNARDSVAIIATMKG